MYKLRPGCPDFTIVDGPLAGRKYEAGKIYDEVPVAEQEKFEVIPEERPARPSRKETK